jgi:hypothetical protein
VSKERAFGMEFNITESGGRSTPCKVLRGQVAMRARDLLRQIFQGREVGIVQGANSPDHIYMLVIMPLRLAPTKLVQYIKDRSSRMLQDKFTWLTKRCWVNPYRRSGTLGDGERGGRGIQFAVASRISNRGIEENFKITALPGLKLALGRTILQTASAASQRLSVAIKPAGFSPVVACARTANWACWSCPPLALYLSFSSWRLWPVRKGRVLRPPGLFVCGVSG